eukprot:CAMPEP_0185781210 /NCGR_PEP_ID=MMETSP1174-20130828/101571_1 /TAXON_ID=35687 /ORGANISM="Dictyocha speculum, Strain CCMP1381" /LENGTH=170 /DNA_ID=CAMNT_0028471095 /DNA_START=30 /DNA_END=543 /DNA_ORIENTATION=-
MSWFRRKSSPNEPTEKIDMAPGSSFVEEKTDVAGGSEFHGGGGSFGSEIRSPVSSGGGAQNQQAQLQAIVQQEQKRVMIEQVMGKLTEIAFEQCIGKPGDALGNREKDCINATVQKYFDTTEFVGHRYQRQQQSQKQSLIETPTEISGWGDGFCVLVDSCDHLQEVSFCV